MFPVVCVQILFCFLLIVVVSVHRGAVRKESIDFYIVTILNLPPAVRNLRFFHLLLGFTQSRKQNSQNNWNLEIVRIFKKLEEGIVVYNSWEKKEIRYTIKICDWVNDLDSHTKLFNFKAHRSPIAPCVKLQTFLLLF